MAEYVTSEELQEELEKLADELGISVAEAIQVVATRIDTNDGLLASLRTDSNANAAAIAAITEMDDNGVESLSEKIKALNDLFKDEDGVLEDVIGRITANEAAHAANATALEADAQALVDYKAAMVTEQDLQDSRMGTIEGTASDLTDTVAANKTAIEGTVGALDTRVVAAEGSLTTLTGDVSVDGSVASSVEAEAVRAKNVSGALADLVTADKASLVAAINEVELDGRTAQAAAEAAQADVDSAQAEVDVLNGDDTVEGSVAKSIADATSGSLGDLGDRMDATEAAQGADEAAITVLNGDASVAGSVDKKIADAATTSNVITDALSGRVDAEEAKSLATNNILQDTTDADDNLVKGIVSRVADSEGAIATEGSRALGVEAGLQAAIDELQGSGMAKGVICGRKAANKFRLQLGQAEKSFDCGSSSDDDGEAI